jgi:hypothetical protein
VREISLPTEFDPQTVQSSRYTDYASTGTKCIYGIRNRYTGELHLNGLFGMASQPDKQKIRIIGFFFENGLHWKLEEDINFYTRLF